MRAGNRAVQRGARAVARRVLRVEQAPVGAVTRVPDDLPRDDLFTQPLVVGTEALGEPEPRDDGQWRVTFRVVVKDAEGKRCPDLHVEAEVTGPTRSAVGETTTDMLGAARFRMTGPAGRYAIEVVEVAALALAWDRRASTTTATVVAG